MRVLMAFFMIMVRLVVVINLVVMIRLVAATLTIVVVMVTSEMVAVHINAAMEVTIRLVHKRATYRLTSVAKRDSKRTVAAHNLGHAFNVAAAESHKTPHEREAAESHKRPAHRAHSRFLPNTNEASERRTET